MIQESSHSCEFLTCTNYFPYKFLHITMIYSSLHRLDFPSHSSSFTISVGFSKKAFSTSTIQNRPFFHSTLFIFFIAVIRVSNYIFICVIICLLCLPSRIKTSVRPTQCLLYAAQSTETDNQLMSKTMTDVLK